VNEKRASSKKRDTQHGVLAAAHTKKNEKKNNNAIEFH
jgi:hypothetical protein